MIEAIQGDITQLDVDVIVNAANKELRAGGGVCGAIFLAAGHDYLARECELLIENIGELKAGDAVWSLGYDLPHAVNIIHAVGPIIKAGTVPTFLDKVRLASAYINSLDLVVSLGLTSVAFPCISTGVYGYPKKQAARIAVQSVQEWMKAENSDLDVIFCCFTDEDYEIYQELLGN